ncbi:DUF4148 domain-containing protein [Variovorax sp. HJSM1_2]|uniref:DUF4148 domain-containing protein n=1 Tax=Variovorax sp. HJSM1_2 TaxID=3366263 RepID=UPI003BBC616D
MNASKILSTALIALAAASAGSAFAADDVGLPVVDNTVVSSKTRAQVQAEYVAAVKAGEISTYREQAYGAPLAGGGSKTRDQVRAELIAAQENGQLALHY